MPTKGPRGSVYHSSGPKHKRTKKYMEAYWPYMPMLLIVVICLFFGNYHPTPSTATKTGKKNVLAYAVSVSPSALLQATNDQRTSNSEAALSLNPQLNTAAQAKANDMVARNYWSHTTPDGQQPWVFVQGAGYSYSKAGENLAYGFLNSSDTVTGWMNSAPHRANILDAGFKDVGFGIANSPNFTGTGPQTVVVAMYGAPQVLGANVAAPAAKPTTPAAAITQQVAESSPSVPSATPEQATPAATSKAIPVTTDTPNAAQPVTQQITRVQSITGGKTPGVISLVGLIASLAILILLFRHSVELKKVLRKGERFALKHPIFDTTMVSIVMLAYVLSATTGFIR